MHRKTLVTAACGAVAALVVGLTGPAAQARVVDTNDSSSARSQARLSCPGGVVGVTSDRHVVSYGIKNGRVNHSQTSDRRLGYDVSAVGYFDTKNTRRKSTLRLNAVAGDGVPRQLSVTYPNNSDEINLGTKAYDNSGFSPRLYADGYSFYAYTVSNSGTLQRYTLFKNNRGVIRFAGRVTVGNGYGSLTSLQAGSLFGKGRKEKEYLYATTSSGALKQIVVPTKRPTREKVRTLKANGYDGVTELVWSMCNSDWTHTLLFGIDPVADTATWTTVKNTTTRPQTRLRGELNGRNVSWDLTAAY